MKHVVVDLEMNPVSREFREVRRKLNEEVIEIGAVRLDENFQQEAEFQCYVKPEYGPIKKHITSLTGITQAMVADKKTYAACFQDFVDWVGEEETKIYSWSMSDIKQLRSECRYKLPDFDIGWLNARWVDLQQEFDDRLGLHNSLALKHALGAMDHKFEGTQHTALADAINTSAILTLMQDDAKFKETMKPVLEILQPKDDLASSIGDLCPELAKLQKDL
ncbi:MULTISPECIES: 3'-5' exonuclease [Mitsuokella]|uniref:3'-5' exonuclease n=1 Tax=Mitsuokella TaxID=52225 RepID=UPI001D01E170|nr:MULTISPECIES: 3'-5' exonuclease [Mitsuokella]MCB5725932.1 exonuclease domain-containing protein [Mitsuokella jalaludinii]MCI7184964.1 exonuclease domain-containing protein [Mitsuokella jalaludinii]MCI7715602.1 exonuclease domain-containing protein [Mitsuokella jalaludinii]MDY5365012.1 3'-5' exonuclease [Mitsuokella jalaludinii]